VEYGDGGEIIGSDEPESAGFEIRWVEISGQSPCAKHACEQNEKLFVCEEWA